MRVVRIVFCFCGLATSIVFAGEAGLTVKDFFGDFEGASLIHPTQLGMNHFTVEDQSNKIFGYEGSLQTWVCAGIRLDRAKVNPGDVVRIEIEGPNEHGALHAVYSYDCKNWKAVPTQRKSSDFDVPLEPGRKAVYFASFYPYFYSQMVDHNRKIARSKYVKFARIGSSVHGREIAIATITDPRTPDGLKRRAFLIGGTHGAETASLYGVEGMLDFLISQDTLAQEMRGSVVWKIIPILNVDAAAEGLDRRNAAGINLYFDWGSHEQLIGSPRKNPWGGLDPSVSTKDFSQPETQAAWYTVMQFRPDVFVDVHSWHFSGDGFWGPDPAAESPAITALKNAIARYFKIQHWDHEPMPFASAPTVAKRLNIAATLSEFALSFDSDGRLKTPDSMRRQGVAVLRGTYEYLRSLH